MTTASTHNRQRRHPATEAGLWLLWITARVTGLAPVVRAAHRRLTNLPLDHAAHLASAAYAWAGRHTYTAWTRLRGVAHRAVIRAELAAADLLTGPAPALLDAATARVRRRAAWLLLLGATALTLLHLAIR